MNRWAVCLVRRENGGSEKGRLVSLPTDQMSLEVPVGPTRSTQTTRAASRPFPSAGMGSALVLFALAVYLFLSAVAAPAGAAARGIVDHRLEYHGGIALAPVTSYAAEMGPAGLNAKWTRILVYWDSLYPVAPWQSGYEGPDQTYLNELDTVVQALRDQGMTVILTGSDPPAWARDTRYKKYWHKNPTTAVVRVGDARVLSAFRGFARFIAEHYAPMGVRHFEVWNEPNLRLIPQIVGKKIIGPEVYRKMLVQFSKGAHAGNRSAVVIAGATSRMGSPGTSTGSTSPQWFAKYLKRRSAARWFDGYSHHPYSTRMSPPAPSAMPRRPDISVTLGNLPVLLRLFSNKPFYLTEFCYSTDPKRDAFVLAVSKADQARYMRQAYALFSKRAYRQVKVMLWFLVRDWQAQPSDPDSLGVYTGVIDTNERRKPSWYAFAGGNKLTIDEAPASSAAGAAFDMTGVLTTRQGPEAGITVKLQRRGLSATKWRTVSGATATTDADGAYRIQGIKQTLAQRYRVIWDGVRESRQITVALAK